MHGKIKFIPCMGNLDLSNAWENWIHPMHGKISCMVKLNLSHTWENWIKLMHGKIGLNPCMKNWIYPMHGKNPMHWKIKFISCLGKLDLSHARGN